MIEDKIAYTGIYRRNDELVMIGQRIMIDNASVGVAHSHRRRLLSEKAFEVHVLHCIHDPDTASGE
jgi:hypothetical protein